MKRFFIFAVVAASILTAGAARAQSVFRVLSRDGISIPHAKILIGLKVGAPFLNNVLETDDYGIVAIPLEWASPQSVTAQAAEYARQTQILANPGALEFRLTPLLKKQKVLLKGQATNFGDLPNDGFAHFSLVLPIVKSYDLFKFNSGGLLSPEVDILTVYGRKMALPSNLTLPRQRQQYGIIPVTLDKAEYRWTLDAIGNYSLAAIHGKFPFKKVIGAIENGKPITDVFNDFAFINAGVRDVSISSGNASLDIPVNDAAIETHEKITAPQMEPGMSMGVAAFSPERGGFYPSDIKLMNALETRDILFGRNFQSGKVFAIKTKGAQQVLNNLVGEAFSGIQTQWTDLRPDPRYAIAIAPFSGAGVAPQFLPLVNKPAYVTNQISAEPPRTNPGPNAQTLFSLDDVTQTQNEFGKSETVETKWEFLAPGWIIGFELPDWSNSAMGDLHRINVSFMGTPDASGTTLQMTHNALDF